MSANTTIKEGDKSRRFGGVKYLRTNLSGGGVCEWVPESERKLTTKTVKKNGTYNISDEKPDEDGNKYYGFSQFTVNVKNSTTGRKNPSTGGDGNEYSVKPNEDTGMLEETVLPSSIRIVGNPTKTQYNDGEAINKAGMVVKAYLADGTLYDYSGYQAGAIPLSELTLDPTTASGSGETYTDGHGLNAIKISYTPHQHTVSSIPGRVYTEYAYNKPLGKRDGYDVTLGGSNIGDVFLTKYNGCLYGKAINSSIVSVDLIAIHPSPWNSGSAIYTAINESNVYIIAGGTSARFNNNAFVEVPWEYMMGELIPSFVPESTVDPTKQSGDLHPVGGGQTITVKWNRPEDEKELTDTFNITVTSGTGSGGGTGGNTGENNTGGGGGSW